MMKVWGGKERRGTGKYWECLHRTLISERIWYIAASDFLNDLFILVAKTY